MTVNDVSTQSQDAVLHGRQAVRAAELAWIHLNAEYTQDIDQVIATIATDMPLTWTLPEAEPAPLHYRSAVTIDEIRKEYEQIREWIQIWDYQAFNEIRNNWYVLTHGVVLTKSVPDGVESRVETVTMFPVGGDGILGEVQIGEIGIARENRWSEVPSGPGDIPIPEKKLEALALSNTYIEALRKGDVAGIVAAHRTESAATIRSYLTDTSTVVNATGSAEIGSYYEKFFEKYRVVDIQMLNRLIDTWFVFTDLLWTVEEISTGRRLEFCTAETGTLDPDCKFWARTGSGTDPVELD